MFRGLKLYTVHMQQRRGETIDKPVFIREGFNFYAFIFTFLWALYQRCFGLAALIFSANLLAITAFRMGMLNEVQFGMIGFMIQLLVGFHANDFLRARLKRTGYIFHDITSGDSLLRAQQRYFDRLVAHHA